MRPNTSFAGEKPLVKIIDMHCHCAGIGAGDSGCFVSKRLKKSWKYRPYLRGASLTEEELVRNGDQISVRRIAELVGRSNSVDGVVALALDAVIDEAGEFDRTHTIFYVPNEFLAKETARYDHLYFGASVNPYRRDALERLEWCKKNGAKLVKWLPSVQQIDPSDRRFEPFYRKLIELDLPLLCHAGNERSFTHAHDRYSDPLLLRFPLQLGVRVVAAHMGSTGRSGGQDNFERTIMLMDEFPNLWGDLSALTQINRKRFLRRMLKIPWVQGRVLFGTDYPLMNMALVSPYYFPFCLHWKQMRQIAGIENPWDRDVALKQALGVTCGVFRNSARFLGIH
jgi:predicted TIM-barrel fold metal-dependent hydrolase